MYEAESTSVSPSPSISMANTENAPFADVVITCVLKLPPLPSRFSYHAIVSSPAESTSVSPSPSMSIAYTDPALSAEVVMVCSAI